MPIKVHHTFIVKETSLYQGTLSGKQKHIPFILGARQTYPIMDLIAISAQDFGFYWGKNGEIWIQLSWMWI